MLRVALKGTTEAALLVTPEEDRVMRAAFGRYGGRPQDRAAGALVVARYQQLGSGHWFLCDCRGGAQRPPALVPVAQTHIRRHEDQRWPVHCDDCDFYRDQDEQRALTASYARPSAGKPMRLARPLGRVAQAAVASSASRSPHTSRPGLARLLIRLLVDAGLQRIEPGWRPPPLVEQVKAIWAAARDVEIDDGVRLTGFLCTSPARLGELMARVAAAPAGQFRNSRPHGVLIARVASIGAGQLQPVAGAPIRVRGRLAVFGEQAGAVRESGAERAARAPYLAACLVGRALEGAPVEVLSAYVHPCAGDAHLMLLDSDLERRTLALLRRVQGWLGKHRGVSVAIEKPMYDIAPPLAESVASAVAPRAPCIPDFILRAGCDGETARTVVVETMGFADAAYRARKRLMHPLMAVLLGDAPVIAHDFHEPADLPQARRDDRMWQAARLALSNPGQSAAATDVVDAATAAAAAAQAVLDH